VSPFTGEFQNFNISAGVKPQLLLMNTAFYSNIMNYFKYDIFQKRCL